MPSTSDVRFVIPGDMALELQKDQEVIFSGTIDHVQEFVGSIIVYIKDVYLDY